MIIIYIPVIFILSGIIWMLVRLSDNNLAYKVYEKIGKDGLERASKTTFLGIFYILGFGLIIFSIGVLMLIMNILSLIF